MEPAEDPFDALDLTKMARKREALSRILGLSIRESLSQALAEGTTIREDEAMRTISGFSHYVSESSNHSAQASPDANPTDKAFLHSVGIETGDAQ